MTDVIVVGAGLASLAAGIELAKAGRQVRVLEAKPYFGGQTASWNESGMTVESGLHRVPAFYMHLPKLMEDSGLDLSKALIWEDEVEISIPDGASLPRRPFQTMWSAIGPGALCSIRERLALATFFTAGLRRMRVEPTSSIQFQFMITRRGSA